MSAALKEHVFDKFTRHFGPPQTTDLKRFLADYIRELKGVSEYRLERMSDYLVRHHKYRNWPTIGECLDALRVLRLEDESETRLREARNATPEVKTAPTAEASARVNEMVRDTIAKLQAVEMAARAPLPLLEPTDSDTWAQRQADLLTARKSCLSNMKPTR